MAKIAIKTEKITPFGGIFPIMEQFSSLLSSTIDSTLGLRCKLYGYQLTTRLQIERLSNSTTSVEGRSASSTTWRADSAGTDFLNPSWTGTRYFFCLQPSYETSINSSWEGLTLRSLDSKHKPHQGVCLQVHLCTSKVDQDIKAVCAEYLFMQQRLC